MQPWSSCLLCIYYSEFQSDSHLIYCHASNGEWSNLCYMLLCCESCAMGWVKFYRGSVMSSHGTRDKVSVTSKSSRDFSWRESWPQQQQLTAPWNIISGTVLLPSFTVVCETKVGGSDFFNSRFLFCYPEKQFLSLVQDYLHVWNLIPSPESVSRSLDSKAWEAVGTSLL